MLELVKKLSLLDGTSGREDDVREFIINEIKDCAEIEAQPLLIDTFLSDVQFANVLSLSLVTLFCIRF